MNKYIVTVMLASVLSGCDAFQGSSLQKAEEAELVRVTDPAVIVAGASLYQRHCAECHGMDAGGDPGWRERNADGEYPPPPLNGRGHAWHHSKQRLVEMIAEGSGPGGSMPAWEGRLNHGEMASIVAWLQAQWPDMIYDVWQERQLVKLKAN